MNTTTPQIDERLQAAEDFLPLQGTDHLEFYVGNAKQAAYFYQSAFGFKAVAYAGPETGLRDRVSYVLQQGKIRFVLTTPLRPEGRIADHIYKHGDGVGVYAITVEDAAKSFQETTRRGAKAFAEPYTLEDENGKVVIAGIHTYGDTVHLFVERKDYNGPHLPNFRPYKTPVRNSPVGLQFVDHCVGNVGWGEMNTWVDFYNDVMGFKQLVSFDDKDISTDYTALMSKVMSSGNEYIKFPINEPAEGKKKSQIEEYIDYYQGPGIQHVAMATYDIITTVANLRDRGVEFLEVPETYYDDLLDRVGDIAEPIELLRQHRILVDRDDEGYLLQLFTKPVEDRPTLFFEIIQRKGARSFGKGNFKALFEAIEREQGLRGNL